MEKKNRVKKPSIQQQMMDTIKVPMTWIEAPAWKRMVAFIFDMFLIAPVSNYVVRFNVYLPAMLIAVYYIGLELSPWKGSVGKRMMSMKVVDDNHGKVSLQRLLIRYFSKIISLLLFGAGYWLPMMGKKRPLPDQISHTMVIALTPTKS